MAGRQALVLTGSNVNARGALLLTGIPKVQVIDPNIVFAKRDGGGGSKEGTEPKGASKDVFRAGKTTVEDITANPKALSGKSADEIAQMLREAGYDVTVQASKKSTSGAKIIKINNPGEGRNITQVQVSPGGGRHGANPYVKISTSDQGIVKVVDGAEDIYKTDGSEIAKIIFTGGK